MNSQQPREVLLDALHRAAELLPAQAPLHAFVHENPLHAYEHLPFHEAVQRAAQELGAEPYPSEALFSRLFAEGSLTQGDIDSLIERDLQLVQNPSRLGDLRFADFAKIRVGCLFEVPTDGATVRFLFREGRLFAQPHELVSEPRRAELRAMAERRFSGSKEPLVALLRELWTVLESSAPVRESASGPSGPRRRDQLLRLTGIDTDHLIHPLLIRLTAAFLDQGVAYWEMPGKEKGLYGVARELLSQPGGLSEPWQAGLIRELERQRVEEFSAETACIWAFSQLQVPEESWAEYLGALLLSLRGWAGMVRKLEREPHKAPLREVRPRLVEFAALALLFETFAVRFSMSAVDPPREPRALDRLVELAVPLSSRSAGASVEVSGALPKVDLSALYEAFVMAQVAPLGLEQLLDRRLASFWFDWNGQFSSLRRRRLLLEAAELHHRQALGGALLGHAAWLKTREPVRPRYQAVFCIDDREESFRRNLEETDPEVETFSYPGFFGIKMRYSGLGEVRPQDLCPVTVTATHSVRELAVDPEGASRLSGGQFHLHVGSRTLLRGLAFSALGWLSLFPLVLGVLFPRWFHGPKRKARSEPTRLVYERTSPEAARARAEAASGIGEAGSELQGYTPEEMADVVEALLRQTGMRNCLSPLVLVLGHGSTSINNPHQSAYGCGATAGGCGGPNARVLALMANRTDVRQLLEQRGCPIPEVTRFIGGVHDTCSDDVTLYDADVTQLSESSSRLLGQARLALDVAAENNAQERCRLFEQVETDISPRAAKWIVESRAVDLSQPRPEYNHAKNSVCFVGRRKWTRGLFLDQRAFLVSYDPDEDETGDSLLSVLLGSVPVGMGINLEYFFSQIDQVAYGSGSKLPHNVSGLVGVMDGHSSDLRTGLYAQMVELHEPLRLVVVVEASPERLMKLLTAQPRLHELVENGWIHLLAFQPDAGALFRYQRGAFWRSAVPVEPLPSVETSRDWFFGRREPLAPAHIRASLPKERNGGTEEDFGARRES